MDNFFSEALSAITGPLGADLRMVVLIGISVCLMLMGLRFILGLLGVNMPKSKDDDDDD